MASKGPAFYIRCDGCGHNKPPFGGVVCPQCLAGRRTAERQRELARRRRQAALGTVGDENRAKFAAGQAAHLAAQIRAEFGCPRRAG